MTDDYMLGLHGDNINSFINSSILKDEELKKWHELKADDNPVLIKYYFKKDWKNEKKQLEVKKSPYLFRNFSINSNS